MDKFDISIWAIGKVALSGAFIYVIAPALLVLRDLIVLKVIEKWILTEKLTADIRLCESDRWQLKKREGIISEVKIPVSGGDTKYLINEKEVPKEDFDLDKNSLSMHINRFHTLDSRINMRNNLILWLTKHYNQDNFISPIPKLREKAYEKERNSDA